MIIIGVLYIICIPVCTGPILVPVRIMATSSTSASELTCVSKREDLTIIETSSESEVYVYTIPSFPVFSVQLRRMKWQFVAEETGSTHVCDGYVRHCAEINKFMGPVTVHVDKGYSCMFFIEVSMRIRTACTSI